MPTFVTTSSYGSWLPGDARGWVSDGRTLPASPIVEDASRTLMNSAPVEFSAEEQEMLCESIQSAAAEFRYTLTDLSIESWHIHWIINHTGPIKEMIGRLKTRMRQRLNRGRIWTEGYCARSLLDQQNLDDARRYIAKHAGCRILHGKPISAPGSAGGPKNQPFP